MHRIGLAFFCRIVILLAMSSYGWGSDIALSESQSQLNVTPYLYFVEDKSGQLTLEEVSDDSFQAWQPPSSGLNNLNFGYTDASYWLRFSVRNVSDSNLVRFIEIAYPVLDYIDLYLFRDGQLDQDWQLGDKYPFSQRPIKHHHFIVPFNVAGGQTVEFFLKVSTTSSMQIPIHLWDEARLLEDTSANVLSLGLYYGTMIVMVLYNLFVFLSVREVTYLYYVLFVANMALFLASINGISYQYLWPNELWWNDQAIIVCLTTAIIFGALFTSNFLKLKSQKPRLHRLFMLGVAIAVMILVGAFFAPYSIMIRVLIFFAVLAILVAIPVGILRWSEGDSAAKYYTIAWSTLLMGGIILAMNKFNFLPRNGLTENATQLGSALEVVLLSLALADRLNSEKRARYQAQQSALENEQLLRLAQAETLSQEQEARLANEKALQLEKEAREAQAKALEIQRRANETLESRVKERTNELEKANRKLEQLTFTDGLTGIRNRRYFDRSVETEFHRACREQQPLSLLVIDIDHFKKFNDDYGHLIGDDCLRAVAHTIRGQIHRDTDVVARYGGEEFVVLMPNTDETGANHIAEKIRQQVESLDFRVEGERAPVTISIGGITHTPKDTKGQELFVAAADEALYASKASGRNRSTLYAVDGHLEKGEKKSGRN